jgi:hypothetical protein
MQFSGTTTIVLSVAILTSSFAFAQEASLSWQASPDVYKVIGENAQYRIILATWKPGQIDNPHAHKAGTSISITDCNTRNRPTGAVPIDNPPRKAGEVQPYAGGVSHQFENIGNADCQIVLIEMK